MDLFGKLANFLGLDDSPRFSKQEVARHHTANSMWIIAGTKVYDITQFLHQHPGGMDALVRRGGGIKDCTRDLGFHSSSAQSLWKTFYIGELAPGNGKTDEAGRVFLRSRGFVPVEELPASDPAAACASKVKGSCADHMNTGGSSVSSSSSAASAGNAGKAPVGP